MTSMLLELAREGFWLAVVLAAPLILASLLAGVCTAVVGWVTQVRDPALGVAPRVAAVALALAVTAPVIARQVSAFTTRALTMVAQVRV